MSFDYHGQVHCGSVGLFDCPFQAEGTEARLRKNAERREVKTIKKAERALKDQVWNLDRSHSRRASSLLNRLLRKELEATPPSYEEAISEHHQTLMCIVSESAENVLSGDHSGASVGVEETYDPAEVDYGLDSPLYEEPGLVTLKAHRTIDVRVVLKSQIRATKYSKAE